MRIIAGIYKGRQLISLAGKTSRPTTDFTKEMIFSSLYSYEVDLTMVLDLFAGSGRLGLEALSRGAKKVTFVDSSKKAISTIIQNTHILMCQDRCQITLKTVDSFLTKIKNDQYSLIMLDPPYQKGLVNQTIKLILANNLLLPEGIIVIEHSYQERIHDDFFDFIIQEKKNGHTIVTFIQKK